MRLGEILVKQGLLDQAQLASALTHQPAQGTRLGTYLVEQNILTCDQVALALAEQFGVPPALEADFLRAEAALRKRLVVHQAIELQAIPLFFINPRRVAMANPANQRALDRLAFILSATVEPLVAPEVALSRQFEILYKVRRKRAVAVARLALDAPPARQPVAARISGPESSEIRPALRSHRRRPPAPRLAPLKPGVGSPEPAAPVMPPACAPGSAWARCSRWRAPWLKASSASPTGACAPRSRTCISRSRCRRASVSLAAGVRPSAACRHPTAGSCTNRCGQPCTASRRPMS